MYETMEQAEDAMTEAMLADPTIKQGTIVKTDEGFVVSYQR
jgi:hypothetical protein